MAGSPPVIHTDGKTTTIGPRDPYKELLARLGDAAELVVLTGDRAAFQRLAWFLGMNGETEACVAIMKHAYEPEPLYRSYMGHVF